VRKIFHMVTVYDFQTKESCFLKVHYCTKFAIVNVLPSFYRISSPIVLISNNVIAFGIIFFPNFIRNICHIDKMMLANLHKSISN
jgi:hypothetical protein